MPLLLHNLLIIVSSLAASGLWHAWLLEVYTNHWLFIGLEKLALHETSTNAKMVHQLAYPAIIPKDFIEAIASLKLIGNRAFPLRVFHFVFTQWPKEGCRLPSQEE